MQKISPVIYCLILIVLHTSCGTPKNFQHAIYLQDSVTDSEKIILNTPLVITPGDRLNISITAVNKEAADAFNLPTAGAVQGYLVDSAGNIQLLQLGVIHVQGSTPLQLEIAIQQQLVNYIKGPVVTVNIINFKINVLGEVGQPGTLNIPDGKINLLQAISQTGDLTLFARRDNILVIREVNGKREFGRLDVSSNHVFESPYFNLKQNDIIYVEPDKTRFISNDAITTRNLRNLGIGVTLLSSILLLVNLFKK